MTKQEILKQLETSGEISVFRRSANWEKAFEAYKKEKGGHKNMNCGSCFRDVLAWLRS